MRLTRWLLLLVLAGGSAPVGAQDVEMLGRRHGTRPPDGYFRELAANPEAFRFTRGRAEPGRMRDAARALGRAAAGIAAAGGPAAALGPRSPVTGTYRIPLILGLFSDSPSSPPFSRTTVQNAYFGGATGTITDYYDEISGGELTLLGDTRDWVQSSSSQSTVTQGQSALVCCGIGTFIKSLLALQTGVDWGLYDNDGPDGLPDSGDDDGYVDALAVMHPTRGAECGGGGQSGRIWSHKWTLSDASGNGPYQTSSPRFGGGFISIEDYFVQGVVSCDQVSLAEIGVFAHETGHAFGLPDLYDTRGGGGHSGAGNWDLMSSGTWGCDDNSPDRPCHMGAWTKAMLGWVDVITLAPDTDLGTLTLPPVETDRTVFRVDAADGSDEYFLLENRQRIGYDDDLWSEGLLVWQIDQDALDARWANNSVNSSFHMAVWLRQADGLDDLSNSSQDPGDAGDPFPGQTNNTAYHAGSNPGSISFAGGATGLTILDVDLVGDDVDLRLLTRFTRLTLTAAGASPGASGLFTVDGDPVPSPPANVVLSAPYESRMIEAAAGELIQPGERRSFLEWTDAPSEPRARTLTTPVADATYEAAYGGTQYQLGITLAGGVNGVAPATLSSSPPSLDLWFAPATSVQVTATPRTGFTFLGWTGALSGQPNTASVVMNGPIFGGADFQLVYAVADVELDVTATVAQDVQLTATNGTQPFSWAIVAGSLPAGLSLSSVGRLTGVALDVGSFPLTVEATDAIGLTAEGGLSLEVTAPSIALADLLSQFLLTGPALGLERRAFLDHQGNDDGEYDLGDLRSWILSHPALPLSAALLPSPSPSIVVVPLRPKDADEDEEGQAR